MLTVIGPIGQTYVALVAGFDRTVVLAHYPSVLTTVWHQVTETPKTLKITLRAALSLFTMSYLTSITLAHQYTVVRRLFETAALYCVQQQLSKKGLPYNLNV